MTHYLIELALWMLVFFFAGCCIGCLLKKLFSADEPVAVTAGSTPAAESQPVKFSEAASIRKAVEPAVAATGSKKAAAPQPKEPVEPKSGKVERPKGIAAARNGKPDKLQRISGIGPKNEKVLHGLGFFHFDQISAWTAGQVDWIDDHLKFNGRIQREEWTKQARLLAEGKEQEFAKLYGTGGLRNKQGETQSGSRTRKN